ncbi:hypothetical protein HK405_007229 [Cladochytrium tenue]|nr:hypothetical protein HK405_007229 [Cladochytrium tenue]
MSPPAGPTATTATTATTSTSATPAGAPAATAAADEPRPWGLLTSLNPDLQSYRLTKVAAAATGGRGAAGSGYLFGRHRECDVVVHNQQLSKRHCLIFKEFGDTDDDDEGGHVFIEDLRNIR